MKTFSLRVIILMTAATSLIFYPKTASATTVDVTVGPGGDLVFSPSSVTIHPGDQVRWTWGSGGHSTTSGSRGNQTGSGIPEFTTRERPSLAPSTVPEHSRTIAFRTADVAKW